jgi:hypothetical protein
VDRLVASLSGIRRIELGQGMGVANRFAVTDWNPPVLP